MFISEKEAKERLHSDKNIFSRGPVIANNDQVCDENNFENVDTLIKNGDIVEDNVADSNTLSGRFEHAVESRSFLNSFPSQPTTNLEVIDHQFRGRKKGDTNIPEFLKVLMGTAAAFDDQKTVANEFGVSLPIVNAAAQGKDIINNVRVQNNQLTQKIEDALAPQRNGAAEVLMQALNILTPERIMRAKTKDISTIAKDMAIVIEKTSLTKKEQNDNRGVQIMIFAPVQNNETHYESIPG